jgi:DNA-binding Lrp family transcriptional regulator
MIIKKTIVDFLLKNPNATRHEIEVGTGLSEKEVRYCVFRLAHDGILKSAKTDKRVTLKNGKAGRRLAGFTVIGEKKKNNRKKKKIKAKIKIIKDKKLYQPKNNLTGFYVRMPLQLHNEILFFLNLFSSNDNSVSVSEFVSKAVSKYCKELKGSIKDSYEAGKL